MNRPPKRNKHHGNVPIRRAKTTPEISIATQPQQPQQAQQPQSSKSTTMNTSSSQTPAMNQSTLDKMSYAGYLKGEICGMPLVNFPCCISELRTWQAQQVYFELFPELNQYVRVLTRWEQGKDAADTVGDALFAHVVRGADGDHGMAYINADDVKLPDLSDEIAEAHRAPETVSVLRARDADRLAGRKSPRRPRLNPHAARLQQRRDAAMEDVGGMDLVKCEMRGIPLIHFPQYETDEDAAAFEADCMSMVEKMPIFLRQLTPWEQFRGRGVVGDGVFALVRKKPEGGILRTYVSATEIKISDLEENISAAGFSNN